MSSPTPTPAPTTPPAGQWTATLQASVEALAGAAQRTDRAQRQASLLREGADYLQIATCDGRITAAHPNRTRNQRPDRQAATDVLHAYQDLARTLVQLHLKATLAYAYGAHQALDAVLSGHTPPQAQVAYDQDYAADAMPTGSLAPLDGLHPSAAEPIGEARQVLVRCLDAAAYAEDLAGRAHVTEREAGAMFDAGREADGTAAAAHAYGRACHQWLPLTIRQAEHARVTAATTAQEQ